MKKYLLMFGAGVVLLSLLFFNVYNMGRERERRLCEKRVYQSRNILRTSLKKITETNYSGDPFLDALIDLGLEPKE